MNIKNEIIWVIYRSSQGIAKYIVTSKKTDRSMYFLYLIRDGKYEKVGKNKDPIQLELLMK